jgi:N-acetylmuramic acid 6-phosphate (MurNAc-6-P) etherase
MNIETSEGRLNTATIDGLQVTRTFTIKAKTGAILIALGTSALLSVSFNGITDDEALALAKKFNWKAIQTALPK